MVTQQYTYAYAAVSVIDGVLDTLILPQVNGDCMQVFLDEVSSRHHEKRIVTVLDDAGWHKTGTLVVPDNMRLVSLPPYAPELNPATLLGGYVAPQIAKRVSPMVVKSVACFGLAPLAGNLLDFY